MKNKLIVILPGLVVIIALLLNAPGQHDSTGQQQKATQNSVITMLASTMPVDLALQNRVMETLTIDAMQRGVFVYAITDVSQRNGYYFVSVSGLPLGATEMHLIDSTWLGMVQLPLQPDLAGYVVELQPSQPTDMLASMDTPNYGTGGAGNILPFRSGTQAQYGTSGVHTCGFNLNGWKAVDLFPAENMIYSSRSGEINYVCRDDTQVAIRIGENLYTHLADNGQQVGDIYQQGQAISGMVPGTFNDTCGISNQNEGTYHVHFCFLPDPDNTFHADGYTLNTNTEIWSKGETTVDILGYLTADWSNAGVSTGATAGGNVWDSTVGGITSMVENTANSLPVHTDMGMVNTVIGSAGPAMDLIYTVVLSNFNLTVPMWVMGIIFVLETVRIAYAGWMWVKKAIPIIG